MLIGKISAQIMTANKYISESPDYRKQLNKYLFNVKI